MRKAADKSARPKRPHRKTVVLPDDACPTCGTMMKETRGSLHTPVNGEEVAVPHVPHFKCPKCGEQVLTYTQARRFEEDAIALHPCIPAEREHAQRVRGLAMATHVGYAQYANRCTDDAVNQYIGRRW